MGAQRNLACLQWAVHAPSGGLIILTPAWHFPRCGDCGHRPGRVVQPLRLSYTIPDGEAVDAARRIGSDDDADVIDAARAVCLLLAVTVRDFLVDDVDNPEAPFDADELEMAHSRATGLVEPTGYYWTTDGARLVLPSERDLDRLTDLVLWDIGDHSRAAWSPLCTLQGTTPDTAIYRLDLNQAAALRLTDAEYDPAAESATTGLDIVTRYLGNRAATPETDPARSAEAAHATAITAVLHAADGWHHAPHDLERALTLHTTGTPPHLTPDTHPRNLEALAGAIADILRTAENITDITAHALVDIAETTFQDEADTARFAHVRHVRQARAAQPARGTACRRQSTPAGHIPGPLENPPPNWFNRSVGPRRANPPRHRAPLPELPFTPHRSTPMQHNHAPDRDDFNARAIPAVPRQRPARPADDYDTARAARIPRQPGTDPTGTTGTTGNH